MKTMLEYNKGQVEKYKTGNNKHNDFAVGTRVLVICGSRDFRFFNEVEATVISNNGGYLGIRVRFDDGDEFGFHPEDLYILKKSKCQCCCHH